MAFQLVITLFEFSIFILIIEIKKYSDAKSIVVAHRKTTPLFGDGLIEAIPDATIETNVHNRAVDGVGGRAAILSDPVCGQRRGPVQFCWAIWLEMPGINAADLFGRRVFERDGNHQPVLHHRHRALYLRESACQRGCFIWRRTIWLFLGHARYSDDQLTPSTLQDLPVNPLLPESPTNKDDIARFTDFMELIAPPPPPPLPLSQQAMQGQNLTIARFPDGGGFHAARRMWPAFS